MPEPEEIRNEVLKILGDAELQVYRGHQESAIGWCVLTIDLENGLMYVNSDPAWDEMSAAVWADKHHRDVNRGAGPNDLGWSTTVLPVLPSA